MLKFGKKKSVAKRLNNIINWLLSPKLWQVLLERPFHFISLIFKFFIAKFENIGVLVNDTGLNVTYPDKIIYIFFKFT